MASETKKKDGPACACGKADLYEEWVKLNESHKEEVSILSAAKQAEENIISDDDSASKD